MASSSASVSSRLSGKRALQRRDVELLHAHQRAHGPLALSAVGIGEHLRQNLRHNLPGHAEFILQPAALAFLTAIGEFAPEVIDFALTVAHHLEGDRLVKPEMRPAVERGEALAVELKLDGQDRARLLAMDVAPGLGVAAELVDPRILEDGDVEIGRLLSLRVEPQTGCDF